VALSLNIDPDKVYGDAGENWRRESQEFQDRIVIARAYCGREKALKPTRPKVSYFGPYRRPIDEEVDLRQFAAWVEQIGWTAPPELLAMVDKQVVGGGKLTGPPANIFKTMDGLKWSEVVMTFITPEEVRIKARERNKTLTYAEMGFKNKQSRMAKPNLCWTALQGLAIIHQYR